MGDLWRMCHKGKDTEGQGAKRHGTHTSTHTRVHTVCVHAQYTHTPMHAHGQVHTCTNTNIHTCKHTYVVTHTRLGRYLLRSSSGRPCGCLEPGEENPDANGCRPAQKSIWQGKATVPAVPRQAPHIAPSTSFCPPHSRTLSNKQQHTAHAQTAPEPPFLRDRPAGAP